MMHIKEILTNNMQAMAGRVSSVPVKQCSAAATYANRRRQLVRELDASESRLRKQRDRIITEQRKGKQPEKLADMMAKGRRMAEETKALLMRLHDFDAEHAAK